MNLDLSTRGRRGAVTAQIAMVVVGLSGAASTATACSSGFSSCQETRTCPADGPSSEGGAGGAPEGVGAKSGVSSGAAGSSGEQSQGGEGATTGPLAIVSTTPADSATDIEREAPIEVVFSAEIDEASISSETFAVTGPSGAVDGKLSVDGAKVTFTPSVKWALRADYEITLAASIESASVGMLGSAASFSFQSRDGAFRKPERLSATDASNLYLVGNRAGYVVAHWNDSATMRGYAAFFDPMTEKWSKAAPIDADPARTFVFTRLCIDKNGAAFASMSQQPPAWSRWADGAWSEPSVAGLPTDTMCAIGDDGTVMLNWEKSVGDGFSAMATSVSVSDEWSAAATLATDARAHSIGSYGSGFLALYISRSTGKTFSRVFEPGQGWLPAKPVTNEVGSYFSFRTFEKTAIHTLADVNDRLLVSLFDGTSWSTEALGSVVGGNSSTLGPKGHVATWFYANNSYAARYDLERGWLEPIKLGPTDGETKGPGVHVDDAGNALAAWRNGSTLSWRRSPHATGEWLPREDFLDQDPGGALVEGASNGDVVVVWQNPLGIWATRFE
jgi:hypothetical protein